MAPKTKITKEDIIKTAISLVREGGEEAINARALAAALNCSTQPIFSNFTSMEELEISVLHAAYEEYLNFQKNEVESGKYPPYKAFGMSYIRFADQEKKLFKFLFMRDRSNEDKSPTEDFTVSVQMLMEANKISEEKAMLMHLEMWAFVHGVATMLATSFLSLEWDLVSNMLSDIYHGIRQRHV